ncbi:MAG: V-type ATP synthase subunit I, partial [Thermoplasmata archaeon]|nr:V-type ATP synthase subunit I [Thermoplasmata archaeon]
LALAINSIFIEMIFPMGILGVVVGLIGIAVGQFFIVVLLGTLSAGIQAIRLNYVEFFMKFYEGNGTPFRPFGATNMYLNRTGVSTT